MTRQISYSQAISEALVQGMDADPNVFIFGLGVDDCKGIFDTTKEATQKLGPTRVFDVPASENALTGIAIGAALNKKRPVLVHARNDFMFLALDQMINNAAKWKYTYNGKSSVPMVVRGIIGRGWGQGPTHSQSIQSVLAHFPGLIVAMPSTPHDVKGIILESLQLHSPVVILEHRALYDLKGPVPLESYRTPFGKGRVMREGVDITIVASSVMVVEALKAAEHLAKEGIELEVIDPVTIQPLDKSIILESLKKTGRLIVADTSWANCGFSAEIAAVAAEEGFDDLKSPVRRITCAASPCPVSKTLEEAFYPTYKDIIQESCQLLNRQAIKYTSETQATVFSGPY